MSILIGHPTGNPNSHHAALAHWESGNLEAFCVAWMPSSRELALIRHVPWLRLLARRSFPPLIEAPVVQNRAGEIWRLVKRAMLRNAAGNDRLIEATNHWVMSILAREIKHVRVTAVHAYEDCALIPFRTAKNMDKVCIYDMPAWYFPTRVEMDKHVSSKYADWLPSGWRKLSRHTGLSQKLEEMRVADLVLVASTVAMHSIQDYFPEKKMVLAPYGVDLKFWTPSATKEERDHISFIYAGQISVHKGIPILLEAWRQAALPKASLMLIGSWRLAEQKRSCLPEGVKVVVPSSPGELRQLYRDADVLVFPSFSEGFGLVILEAMACGLTVIASKATAGPDILDETCGRVYNPEDQEELVETLRWFSSSGADLQMMKKAARVRAEQFSWANYRRAVQNACRAYI